MKYRHRQFSRHPRYPDRRLNISAAVEHACEHTFEQGTIERVRERTANAATRLGRLVEMLHDAKVLTNDQVDEIVSAFDLEIAPEESA